MLSGAAMHFNRPAPQTPETIHPIPIASVM